tara:strand:- start:87 stop:215 length:129 start_codon:yes stop_codon:yes gene_type:complete
MIEIGLINGFCIGITCDKDAYLTDIRIFFTFIFIRILIESGD